MKNKNPSNAILIWVCVLVLCNQANADRFVNTGSGTINTCDSVTRVGIGIVNPVIGYPGNMDPGSNLVLGPNYPDESGTNGGRLQFSAAPLNTGAAAYLDLSLVDEESGYVPYLRFLQGTNYGPGGELAKLSLDSGNFSIPGRLTAQYITILGGMAPPDYVFEPGYKVRSLEETERFIQANKHLPEIPNAEELRKGMDLGDMNLLLLKKVEELTLHAIEQEKRIENLEKKIQKQGVAQ